MSVIVKAGVFLAQGALPHLRAAKAGSIIYTASMAGLRGSTLGAVYPAAKGAIVTLAKTLALLLGGDGIRVNSISPGPVDTPFVRAALDQPGIDADAAIARASARVPLARLGTPDEVARVALFL